MKKMTKLAALLAAILLLTAAMTACGGQSTEPDTPDDGQTGTTAVRIAPIPSGFDPAAPEDCDVSVSFDNGDIKLNDEGVLVLHMTVWEYELFDAAEVSAMKPGDTLVVRGQEIAVTAVESADGVVHVNGGLEKGGVDLAAAESGGVFYESNSAVTEFPYNYVETAQLTLPVDGDSFVYTDTSDLEKGEQTYLAGDPADHAGHGGLLLHRHERHRPHRGRQGDGHHPRVHSLSRTAAVPVSGPAAGTDHSPACQAVCPYCPAGGGFLCPEIFLFQAFAAFFTAPLWRMELNGLLDTFREK